MPYPILTFQKKVNDPIPRNGLVAEYLFNNNVLDTSGNGYNGINNNVTFGTDRNGNANSAGIFNGTNAYVNIDAALAGLSSNTKGTISFWVKTNNDQGFNQYFCFGDTDAFEYLISLNNPAPLTRFQAVNPSNNFWNKQTTFQTIFENVWSNTIIVHNGTEPNIYVDGVLVAQNYRQTPVNTSVWFSNLPNLDNGRIGSANYDNRGNFAFMNGGIDDVRIYNRDLTLAEIQALANE